MELTSRNIMLCEMSAELFKLSCSKNYDSKDFINKLMNSEEGQLLYSNNCTDMWLGAEHVMHGLENEIQVKNGKTLPNHIMAWIGYLFQCWRLTYPNETAKDIIKQAPFEVLVQSYLGYHVMSCEDAIQNLKEININMTDRAELQEMQTKFVIEYIMKNNGITFEDAAKIWYNSKTKKLMQDSGIDYSFVAPTRCYDELLMELNKDPHWMKGQFD